MKPIILTLCAVCLCGCTVSKPILQQALDLDKSIQEFRSAESQRIDKLNQDYREAYDQLSATLEKLGDEQLVFDRGHDAQAFADDILADPDKTTLPGKFSDRLLATVKSQRDQMTAVDNQIQAARDQYAASYKDLKVTLNKLDDLRTQLKVLYTPDLPSDKVSLVVKDVQAAYDGVKAAKADAATPAPKTPGT